MAVFTKGHLRRSTVSLRRSTGATNTLPVKSKLVSLNDLNCLSNRCSKGITNAIATQIKIGESFADFALAIDVAQESIAQLA